MHIPNFRLARASNQIYHGFEDGHSKNSASSREQPILPWFWRCIYQILGELARATDSTMILKMDIPNFRLARASNRFYQDFKGESWRARVQPNSREQPILPGFWRCIYQILGELARATDSTMILKMDIPNFRLARASNRFYHDFEDGYTKL